MKAPEREFSFAYIFQRRYNIYMTKTPEDGKPNLPSEFSEDLQGKSPEELKELVFR